MKQFFTIYLLLISFLVSQDALQLIVKNVSDESVSNVSLEKNLADNSSEDMKDALEDESEITFEICTFANENFILGPIERPSIQSFQKNNPIRNIYLERFTPPPQV